MSDADAAISHHGDVHIRGGVTAGSRHDVAAAGGDDGQASAGEMLHSDWARTGWGWSG